MTRRLIAEILFWLHAAIFATWIILFFIPLSLWPERILFHLYYLLIIVASELITGLLLMPVMHKYRIVCPLTTVMQQVRGISWRTPGNYDHSFVREFAERFGVRLPQGFVAILIFGSLAVVIIQYIVVVR